MDSPDQVGLAQQLLQRVTSYCHRARLSPARVSTLAVNDGDLIRRVSEGGTCTLKTFEKFMAWLAEAERALPPTVPEDVQ